MSLSQRTHPDTDPPDTVAIHTGMILTPRSLAAAEFLSGLDSITQSTAIALTPETKKSESAG